MNKFAKGSLAAGAGVVLLLGGAGTLAYWNSDIELKGGSVSTGKLDLETSPVTSEDAPKLWVPGDEATYTTDLLLTAEGDNLEGEIALDADSVALTGDGAEKILVDVKPAVDELPTGVNYSDTQEVFHFTGAEGQRTIPVEITVTFPFGEEVDNDSQSATVDLADVSFVATQIDPDAA